MKKLIQGSVLLLFLILSGTHSYAQITLGAPGIGWNFRVMPDVPFNESVNIGRYYKYTFSGIEGQSDADGVPGTYGYDGKMNDKPKKNGNGNAVEGFWNFWASVNNVHMKSVGRNSSDLADSSGVIRKYFLTPIVFWEQEIELAWHGAGNSKDPDGHFYILGEAVKEPPVPIGELSFLQTLYQTGEKPPFSWAIQR
ncbi:MAG: hypothetical protein ACI8UO_004260 [Verrucomicrobiales bacterium]|jgi:hypothetical protein